MWMRSLLPAAVLLYGCSPQHRPTVPAPARGPARDSLFQLDQSRIDSLGSRPSDGFVAAFGPDVVYLRAGLPAIYGRDALQGLARELDREPFGMSRQPLGGGVSDDLRSGYTFGIAARIGPAKSAIKLERYIAYWQRPAGQPWRIAAYAEVGAPPVSAPHMSQDWFNPPVRPRPKPIRDAIATIRATDSLFSDLADRMGIPFAFANSVDPYGVVFGTPQLVVGPKAVQEFYTAQGGGSSLTWHPVYADVAGSLDLGYTVGEYSITSRGASGATIQRFGKYLTVWKRQPDGTWKFVIDGGNGTPSKSP